MKFIDNIIEKSAFPIVESAFFEAKKNSLLRIIGGLIIFIRYWQIVYAFSIYNGHLPISLLFFLIICALFIVGFATPVTALLVMFFSHYIDIKLSTSTLGTTILSELLLVFSFGGAGYYYSIDRFILNSNNKFLNIPKKILNGLYSVTQFHTEKDLRKLYFIVFLLYAVSSFTALYLHIKDPTWVNGITTRSLLTNAYLCYYYNFFRNFESNFPVLLSILSICAGIFQSIFQFLMIPLIWNKRGRIFVFVWGVIFFFVSFFFINLSYLPHLEILIWLAIFVPIKLNKEQIAIYYDDRCNLCVKSMKFLRTFNFNNSLLFKPLSFHKHELENSGYSEKEIKAYMLGTYKGKFYMGYDLYFQFIQKNPLYWGLIPVFCLGYIGGIGKRIYSYFAENRYKYFGVCEITNSQQFKIPDSVLYESKSVFFKNAFLLFYSVLIPVFFIVKMCNFNYFGIYFKMLGLERPDVFNKTDLTMSDKWAEIYRYEADTTYIHTYTTALTPIVGTDGQRLCYSGINWLFWSNHNSDYLYFGSTLGYARRMISINTPEEILLFHTEQSGFESLKKRIVYDYNYMKLTGNVKYQVVICSNRSSDVVHWQSNLQRYNKKTEMIFTCFYDNKNFSIKKNENTIQ